jgi:hypothetical protein
MEMMEQQAQQVQPVRRVQQVHKARQEQRVLPAWTDLMELRDKALLLLKHIPLFQT